MNSYSVDIFYIKLLFTSSFLIEVAAWHSLMSFSQSQLNKVFLVAVN